MSPVKQREVTTMPGSFRARGTALLAATALVLLATSAVPAQAGYPQAAPAQPQVASAPMAAAAVLPPSTCTLAAGVRSCDLWAKTGTLTLPVGSTPASVPIWGYADGAAAAASVPGPVLVANQGETLQLTLHNDLTQPSSLAVPGLTPVPDSTGVAPGATSTYTVALSRPGTFRYEAGLTANGPRQVAMGLQGVLVVRPATSGQAYDSPASSYEDEAVVAVSSIDPAFSANPTTYDLGKYAPKYWLLNGKAFPETAAIAATAGNGVLLRYVNGGLFPISMGLLGLHQTVVGTDARQAAFPHGVVAETLPPGTTLDAIAEIPAATPAGTRFPLFEQSGRLDNAGRTSGGFANGGIVDFGGALTYLAVTTAAGPVTSSVAVVPDPSNGTTSLAFSANLTDGLTGGDNITAAEYFIDSAGANGTGTAMTLSGVPAPERQAQAALVPSSLAGGVHTLYVHGQDTTGAWGTFGSKTFRIDNAGPASTVALDPNPENDSGPVAVAATGDDTATGGGNVVAAQLFLNVPCGSGVPTTLTLAGAADVSSTFTGSIAAGRPEGSYVVRVRTQDAVGNWGPCAETTLVVDKTGPATSGAVATPNPAMSTQTVTLQAISTDPGVATPASVVAAAEWFDGADPGAGNGTAMVAVDGAFDETSEAVRATVNPSVLAAGAHTLSVRAKDAAGNWGAVSTESLTVTPSDTVFADGFESGDLTAWSGSSGGPTRIAVSAAAALNGSSFGLRTVLTGNTPSYLIDNRPTNEASTHTRFRFDPNTTTTAGLVTTILQGRTGTGVTTYWVQYRTSAGAFQVRGLVQRSGGTTATNWYSVTDAPHAIEIAWASSASSSFSLYIDGTLRQTLTGLNTSTWKVETTWLGPSAGLATGVSGTEFYDDYVMTRTSLIGA